LNNNTQTQTQNSVTCWLQEYRLELAAAAAAAEPPTVSDCDERAPRHRSKCVQLLFCFFFFVVVVVVVVFFFVLVFCFFQNTIKN
jgi:heme/copper-type cytochrome/quinol oxidase subunit 2